jgi:hypothetical protein
MVGSLLEEVQLATLDDAGRHRLADVHTRAVDTVKGFVSPELQGELTELSAPLDGAQSRPAAGYA